MMELVVLSCYNAIDRELGRKTNVTKSSYLKIFISFVVQCMTSYGETKQFITNTKQKKPTSFEQLLQKQINHAYAVTKFKAKMPDFLYFRWFINSLILHDQESVIVKD